MTIPGFAINLVVGEMGSMLLTSQRAIPENLQKLGFKFDYPDFKGAMTDVLGKTTSPVQKNGAHGQSTKKPPLIAKKGKDTPQFG